MDVVLLEVVFVVVPLVVVPFVVVPLPPLDPLLVVPGTGVAVPVGVGVAVPVGFIGTGVSVGICADIGDSDGKNGQGKNAGRFVIYSSLL